MLGGNLGSLLYGDVSVMGSILRATENKMILRKFVKRCPILLISSNLAFLSHLGQFLTGAKLLLGTP